MGEGGRVRGWGCKEVGGGGVWGNIWCGEQCSIYSIVNARGYSYIVKFRALRAVPSSSSRGTK